VLAGLVVQSYLNLLPAREREVLALEFVHELPPAEIMVRTGLTRGGISAAKTRGLRKLRDILRAEASTLRAGRG
jgi:DNA-directed RNA polymerase specialized sigma24 family protein